MDRSVTGEDSNPNIDIPFVEPLQLGHQAQIQTIRQSSTLALRLPTRAYGDGAGVADPDATLEGATFGLPTCQDETSCAWFDQIAFLGLERDASAAQLNGKLAGMSQLELDSRFPPQRENGALLVAQLGTQCTKDSDCGARGWCNHIRPCPEP
jgi:hypothetical protein